MRKPYQVKWEKLIGKNRLIPLIQPFFYHDLCVMLSVCDHAHANSNLGSPHHQAIHSCIPTLQNRSFTQACEVVISMCVTFNVVVLIVVFGDMFHACIIF